MHYEVQPQTKIIKNIQLSGESSEDYSLIDRYINSGSKESSN